MIILLHGTGDDDSKPENWMRWVHQIAEDHYQFCLTLPGVHSDQHGELADRALLFMDQLALTFPGAGAGRSISRAGAPYPLYSAIHDSSGSELPPCSDQSFVQATASIDAARALIRELGAHARAETSGTSAKGIKLRVALAGICAVTYVRHVKDPFPIRIIGHSRGGATAVGLHNLLTLWNLNLQKTLLLDPCHGQSIVGSAKDYYTKIWKGRLVNIPCVKTVGDTIDVTRRPPIEAGEGADNPSITNHPRLEEIKHGHMGKTSATHTTAWFKKAKKRQKAEQRAVIERIAAESTSTHLATLKDQLEAFFTATLQAPALADKQFITRHVVETLTSPAPPPYSPPR